MQFGITVALWQWFRCVSNRGTHAARPTAQVSLINLFSDAGLLGR